MRAVLERSYELFGVVFGMVAPVPVYFLVPADTRAGAGWIWTVLAYAVVFTALVTAVSVRVFRRSRCCLCTTLRALLLAVCLAAEVLAAFRSLPTGTSRFAAAAAGFSVSHLVAVYLGVWACTARRRR